MMLMPLMILSLAVWRSATGIEWNELDRASHADLQHYQKDMHLPNFTHPAAEKTATAEENATVDKHATEDKTAATQPADAVQQASPTLVNETADNRSLDIELVVARYIEQDLKWLAEVPDYYRITVYNKGQGKSRMPAAPTGVRWTVINLPNIGREGGTFAHHLVRRYDSLAAYTIFTQADPFIHNLHYLDLLRHPELLKPVQTMSRLYKRDGPEAFRTPKEVVEKMSVHPWYRSERFSTRTLNSVWFHDEGTVRIPSGYQKKHGIPAGTNLMHHLLGLIGLPEWMPEDQEVASFAFGALVGFEKGRALQHPKEVYQRLYDVTAKYGDAWVIEKCWLLMFGGCEIRDD